MRDNLVIVESPAKAKTIEKFLGEKFKVMSSYGHIRDLKSKEISIDDKMHPEYEIPQEKEQLVKELKAATIKAKKVWLASDEDREGEDISWHLCEVLGLDKEQTSRIVFHEITPNAIHEAIENPRQLNMDLVNAQQARRVLDRIVGFKISPILWRKIKPALSAGRVQSVAVRLLVEREREIQHFEAEEYFRVNAVFLLGDTEIKAELAKHLNKNEAKAFLEDCKIATFMVSSVEKKPMKRLPAPPFTTSTLQQEASRKLGMTVTQTMRVAQSLYESGKITYMRTDSVSLSNLCLSASKEAITKLYGAEYAKTRNFQTSSKGAQEAHEAIRPTYMNNEQITGTPQEKRLYNLIWKRTIASQMAEAQVEKTVVTIALDGKHEGMNFIAEGEMVKFDGFLKVYRESTDDEKEDLSTTLLPKVRKGQTLERKSIVATQRYTQAPLRYTEASLVKKLEELGIGRPSTYAPTISTIQQREYVVREDCKGIKRQVDIFTLKGGKIDESRKTETFGAEKKKLIPTDIGIVVNDFLIKFFPNIMDYNFTAKVETQFDAIAEGKRKWDKMLLDFNRDFEPEVQKTLASKEEHKAGERQVGTDPKSGKPVYVKIGRFGPVAQIGSAEDDEKPRFAQLKKGMSIETVTLEEVLELFSLPKVLGEFEGIEVSVGASRYGAYILHNKQYYTIPKKEDPITITLQRAWELIQEKRASSEKQIIKSFEENKDMQILNGRYGIYLCYNGKNYRLTKKMQEHAENLTFAECMTVVESAKK